MTPTPFVPFSALLTDSALVFSDFTTGEGISFGRFFGGRPRFRLTIGAVSASTGDSLTVDELLDELTEASGTAAAFGRFLELSSSFPHVVQARYRLESAYDCHVHPKGFRQFLRLVRALSAWLAGRSVRQLVGWWWWGKIKPSKFGIAP